MFIQRLSFIGLLSLCVPAFGQATLYQSVAPDGSLTFSDTPTPGSEPYSLMGGNVSGFTATGATSGGNGMLGAPGLPEVPLAGASAGYSDIIITQPLDQTTFQNQTPIGVSVAIQPALKPGDKIKLMLDGKAVGDAQATLQFSIGNLDRGTHQLQVAVVDSEGKTLKSSLSTTIFKQQASLLLPMGKAKA